MQGKFHLAIILFVLIFTPHNTLALDKSPRVVNKTVTAHSKTFQPAEANKEDLKTWLQSIHPAAGPLHSTNDPDINPRSKPYWKRKVSRNRNRRGSNPKRIFNK